MMKLNLHNESKENLIQMKKDIEKQLKVIDTKEKNSTIRTLKDIKRMSKIFCINFRGNNILHMDYVDIEFAKSQLSEHDNQEHTGFSTANETKPMGCSSSLLTKEMEGHCFLSEFSGGYMYFYTLKPENWKEDLKLKREEEFNKKVAYCNEENKKFLDNVNGLINSTSVDKTLVNMGIRTNKRIEVDDVVRFNIDDEEISGVVRKIYEFTADVQTNRGLINNIPLTEIKLK